MTSVTPVTTATTAFGALLDARTAPGMLVEPLKDGKLRCLACGHRCVVFPGRRGICQVRFNERGTLRVPWGYVAALQCDPTEKKPFFHVLPGSKTLTFGMLGCDLHCPYCFTPETRVVTDQGVLPINEVFSATTGDVTHPSGLWAITARGDLRRVVQVFRHRYVGKLVAIRPYYLPALRCTPDHRIFATADPNQRPQEVQARRLTGRHYLAVPRHYGFSSPQTVDVHRELSAHRSAFATPHRLPAAMVQRIMAASEAGMSSRALGLDVGKDASHIRHIRSKARRGLWTEHKATRLIVESGTVRFSNERRPGIPTSIQVDENFARLLGYYCAEGSVQTSRRRPNSHTLTFSFGPQETALAEETCRLTMSIFGVQASIRARATALVVSVEKASAANLFKFLCGTGAIAKRVAQVLLDAPRPVVQAFLDAYVRGDGCRHPNGKVTVTTRSAALAYGVSWLCLKTGRLTSLYENRVDTERMICGRKVKQSSRQFTIVYDNPAVRRKVVLTEDFYLIPIRSLETMEYDGDVFNMEVEEEHNYLANFVLVANCQNWLTSQVLRDPIAGIMPEDVAPMQLVEVGLRHGAQIVGSSYNEPLITAEWAVDVFKKAREAGLRTCFISNGNATREVLTFLRPWCDCYKIDLKAMSQKNYRHIGGVLDRVLDTIKMVYEMGFWLEIVTLVIPGWNDSEEELRSAAGFIASVSKDVPWHITAFHPDYKMTDPEHTPAATLLRAARIGEAAGLRYVYAGNLPGLVGRYENTFCPQCQALLVARIGYHISQNRLASTGGRCPDCGYPVPGIWT